MARIAVLGGTGYTGGNIVREAAARGHHVTAYSRTAPAEPVAGVHYVQASFLEEGAVAAAVAGQDVVVEALAPRGELAGQLERLIGDLAKLAAEQHARLVVVGGWSGLRPAEGAPRFVEGDMPPQFRAEAEEMVRALETLESVRAGGARLAVRQPGAGLRVVRARARRSARYRSAARSRCSTRRATSAVSGADFALAIVDEIDRHEHHGPHQRRLLTFADPDRTRGPEEFSDTRLRVHSCERDRPADGSADASADGLARGDLAGVEAEQVQAAVEAGVLDLDAAVHHDGEALRLAVDRPPPRSRCRAAPRSSSRRRRARRPSRTACRSALRNTSTMSGTSGSDARSG